MKRLLVFCLLMGSICSGYQSQSLETTELNTILMNSTFRIQGQSANGVVIGTGFLVGRAVPGDPQQRSRYVLVTAAHVFRDMTGDSVLVMMRRKDPQVGWQEVPTEVPIRAGATPLWVQHRTADVAALYISVPNGCAPPIIVGSDFLADDKMLQDFDIHPGDELNVLGYPLGLPTIGGFPVLRSGKIASYPLVPVSENQNFLLDFRVFRGNSGGPVYFVQSSRVYKGSMHLGATTQFVMGLVSEEISVTQQFQGLYENRSQNYPLGLARIVPAAFIRQVVDQLPMPQVPSASLSQPKDSK